MPRFPSPKALPALFLLFLAVPVHAKSILVPTDYPTIQAAVDAAVEGDEILLEPGIYTSAVVVPAIGITIRSQSGNPEDTILDGSGLAQFEPMINLTEDAAGRLKHRYR